MSTEMEPEVAKAILIPGGTLETDSLQERLPFRLQLFDQDGNPVDLSSLIDFINKFDLTGAQDGYLLVYDAVKDKYVPLPLA